MKILISNFHPFKGGGHDIYLRTILSSRINKSLRISTTSPNGSGFGIISKAFNAPFYPNIYLIQSSKVWNFIISFLHAVKILVKLRPALIHTNGGHDQFIFCLTSFITGTNIPIIRSHHTAKKYPNHFLTKFLYNRLTHLNIYQTQSQFIVTTEGKGVLRPQNSITISHGVQLDKYQCLNADAEIINQFQIPESSFVFGSIAGTASYKRVDIFLNAFKQAKINHKQAIIILAGDPAFIDPIFKEVKKLELTDNFVFLGFIDDVSIILPLFDAGFIMSDKIESCSIATREMMAASIPMISSDFPGSKENITDRKDGIIVPACNVEKTAEAIEFFYNLDRETLNQMKKNALKKATKHFDQNKKMCKLKDAYSQFDSPII